MEENTQENTQEEIQQKENAPEQKEEYASFVAQDISGSDDADSAFKGDYMRIVELFKEGNTGADIKGEAKGAGFEELGGKTVTAVTMTGISGIDFSPNSAFVDADPNSTGYMSLVTRPITEQEAYYAKKSAPAEKAPEEPGFAAVNTLDYFEKLLGKTDNSTTGKITDPYLLHKLVGGFPTASHIDLLKIMSSET